MSVGNADRLPDRLSRRAFLKRGGAIAGGAVLAGAAPAFARGVGAADVVLTNAYVWTLNPRKPFARAVAVSGGTIVFVGSEHGAREYVGKGTEVLDLHGRMVLPGIHDGHIHPLSGGRSLTAPSLNYEQLSLSEFLDRIAALLKATSEDEPDGWLVVGQWDAVAMGTLPDRHDLDALPTSRPIFVRSLDGHIAVVNSRALEIAGITAATPDPPNGEIRRDRNGEPTGVLLDGAIGLVSSVIPPPTVEQNARSLKAAFELMNSVGITSYLDASAGEDQLGALASLSDAGDLTLRPSVAVFASPREFGNPGRLLGRLQELRETFGRPDITINCVKLFFDGVIEYPAQTAALLKPYRVNEGTKQDPHWVPGDSSGPTYFPQDVANPGIAALDAAGWQVHVHAIGDRAVHSALEAFAYARSANGTTDRRHTIAHLELVHGDDFARFHQLGVLPNMQLQWAERDTYTMDYLKPYIGSTRWRRLYPAGSLWDSGARVCGGSDWPVDPLLPFRQIEMGVNRTVDEVYEGYPKPLNPQQGLALRSSVAMHTRNSAYQLHQDRTGTIRHDRHADLIVLDRNILDVPLGKVSNTEVLLTMVGGDIVHLSPELVT